MSAYYAVAATGLAFHLVGLGLYLSRRTVYPIRERMWPMTTVMFSFAAVWYFVFCYSDVLAETGLFPTCWSVWFLEILFDPVFAFAYFFRAAYVWFQYNVNTSRLYAYEKRTATWASRLTLLGNQRFIWATYIGQCLFWVTIGLAIQLTSMPASFTTESDCIQSVIDMVIIQGVIVFLLFIFFIVVSWNVRDAFYIKLELKLMCVVGLGVFIVWAMDVMTSAFPASFRSEWILFGLLDFGFLVSIYMPYLLSFEVVRGYIERPSQKPSKAVPDNKELLERSMKNDVLFSALREYALQSFCVENILFYHEVRQFQDLETTERIQTMAAGIVEHFLTDTSILQVNINDKTRQAIMQKITNVEITTELFDEAQREIEDLLRTDTLPKWRATASFLDAWSNHHSSPASSQHVSLEDIYSASLQDKA